MSEPPLRTFADCLYECLNTPGLVAHFNRLFGCHLTPQSTPESHDALEFVAFVYEYVWQPLLAYQARFESAEED
jgi:hypothetical protein